MAGQAKTAPKQTSLLDLPEPVNKTTGNPLDTTKRCTLPLNSELIGKRIDGTFNELDRKLWVMLVCSAFPNLNKQRTHEISVVEVNRVFRELKHGRDGSKWIIESARRMRKCGMDWWDEAEEGTVAFISGVVHNRHTGMLSYEFPSALLDSLLNNPRFARLRLHFMIGLSGKYSVSLYMLLEGVVNMRNPVVDLSVEELRAALKVEPFKLERWVDFKRKALDPALKEINDNPIAAGFSVECELVMRGRKVDRVRLLVTKSVERLAEETAINKPRLSNLSAQVASKGSTTKVSRIPLPTTAYEQAKKFALGWDIYHLEDEWQTWLADKPLPDNPAGSFIGFCKKRGTHPQYRGA